jgi:hypothetical protein
MNEQGQSTFSDEFCFTAGTPEKQANGRMVEWLASLAEGKMIRNSIYRELILEVAIVL